MPPCGKKSRGRPKHLFNVLQFALDQDRVVVVADDVHVVAVRKKGPRRTSAGGERLLLVMPRSGLEIGEQEFVEVCSNEIRLAALKYGSSGSLVSIFLSAGPRTGPGNVGGEDHGRGGDSDPAR